ncbi:holin [Bacteroides graminisolvens]|uniref:holin n=1 Tax=Bacteroides graminisolvens TaxID=477666 RepID=UPI00240A3260|nr:holin [Bacteroides graminisolvens]
MMDKFNEVLMYASVLAVLIPMFIGAIKTAFAIPNNFIPLLSIVLGAVLGGLSMTLFPGVSVYTLIWAGAIAGAGGVGIREVFTKRDGLSK